jgi:hypothetical protein
MTNNILGPRLYVGAVILAGCGLLGLLAPRELHNPGLAVALLASTVCLSVFKLRLPLGNTGVSTMTMAYAVDFVALIVEGANLAMLLGAIGVLIQCTVRVRRKQPIHRSAFSAAAVVIAVQVAGWGWRGLGGNLADLSLASTVLPLMVCAITYFAVNTGLVAGAIAVTAGSPARALNPEFLRTAPAYLASAAVAGLVALAMLHGVIFLAPIVASPLWIVYRGYQKRWSHLARTLLERAALVGQPAAVAV